MKVLENAKAKLRNEMGQNKNNTYIQVVGEFLLQYVESNPGAAERIMSTDKTIEKSLEVMRNEASKKKVGNCAVLTDQEGFAVVLKYFGIDGVPATSPIKATVGASNNKPMPTAPATKNRIDFDLKLEDLL